MACFGFGSSFSIRGKMCEDSDIQPSVYQSDGFVCSVPVLSTITTVYFTLCTSEAKVKSMNILP